MESAGQNNNQMSNPMSHQGIPNNQMSNPMMSNFQGQNNQNNINLNSSVNCFQNSN